MNMNEIEWYLTEVPKDRVILRWHLIYNVPISVKYLPEDFVNQGRNKLDWIEATYAHTWPELAFSPYWAELPKPPPNFDVDVEAIKAPKLKIFKED